MAGLLTTPSLFLCPLQAIPVFRNLRHIKNFGRNSIAMLFLPKFCFLAILFSQGTLYNLAIELLQSRSLRPFLSGHFLLHISIYSFLYKIILTQAVTLL